MSHSKLRAKERFGFLLTKAEIEEMARLCRTGKHYCHLGLQSLTRSKIVLNFKDTLIPVIYDKKRHCIITLLTMDMRSQKEKEFVYSLAEPGNL